MTSQQQADEALAAYWAAKKLLEACFNFPTREEYADQLRCVTEQMSCVISTSEFSSHSSSAF